MTTLSKYEPVIGLEVHAQLLTRSKLFCACSTQFGVPPNRNICPVCTGQPGALPVLNQRAVEFAIKAGLATHCQIAPKSIFARKNYFYPDLPKGYQISQYELPICQNGHVDILFNGQAKRIGIIRIHMEEDAGKSIHDYGDPKVSHVDLNRACTPLIEIVSTPDIRSAEEAGVYLKTLRTILMYLDICDGNMQEGSFRCDANVSIRLRGSEKFGTRTELKNLNSFNAVERAIRFEIERQAQVLDGGGAVAQETRLWNDTKQQTESMRSKEEAHDYRYFPDPDLLPLAVDAGWVEKIRAGLPELAEAKAARFTADYGIPPYDAGILTQDKNLADYFEAALKVVNAPKKISNWIMTELLRELNKRNLTIAECKITPAHLGKLIAMIESGEISGKIAKDLFAEMIESGESPEKIRQAKGLSQVSDTAALEPVVDEILANNLENVAKYKSGKTNVLGFLVGQVIKATGGKASPTVVNGLLRKKLGG